MKPECPACGLSFEQAPGDTWGFWVVLDRIFVAIPIVLIYLGLAPSSWPARLLVGAVLVAALVLTMPHRQGVAVALDYLARRRQGEA